MIANDFFGVFLNGQSYFTHHSNTKKYKERRFLRRVKEASITDERHHASLQAPSCPQECIVANNVERCDLFIAQTIRPEE